jgi:hypothetical protein
MSGNARIFSVVAAATVAPFLNAAGSSGDDSEKMSRQRKQNPIISD